MDPARASEKGRTAEREGRPRPAVSLAAFRFRIGKVTERVGGVVFSSGSVSALDSELIFVWVLSVAAGVLVGAIDDCTLSLSLSAATSQLEKIFMQDITHP